MVGSAAAVKATASPQTPSPGSKGRPAAEAQSRPNGIDPGEQLSRVEQTHGLQGTQGHPGVRTRPSH